MTPPVMVGLAWKLMFAPAGGLVHGLLLDWGSWKRQSPS